MGTIKSKRSIQHDAETFALLEKERDALAAIVEIAGALIVVMRKDGKIIYFNRACEETAGYSAAEMKGKQPWDFLVCKEDIQLTKTAFGALSASNSPLKLENQWQARDGSRRLIDWTLAVLTDNTGAILYIIGTGLDITDKRAADDELRRRTHELGERVKELNCLYGISRLRERKELSIEQICQRVAELIPPAWQYPEITCARILLNDYTFTTANFKETRWLQSRDIVVGDSRVGLVEVYYLKRMPKLVEGPFLAEERSLIDAIAERLGRVVEMKAREDQIIEYQEKLRQLASELSLSEEHERRRIATELHDQIGQTLALTRIKLGELSESVPDGLLNSVINLVNQTIQSTRSITVELSPPVLHEVGFEGALEWLTGRLKEEHGIAAEFLDDKSNKPLSEDVRIVLFQAVGELLHNIVKHARASNVLVGLGLIDDRIKIEVNDDGIGFDAAEAASRTGKNGGFGLFNIRERLSYLGGKLEIISQTGKGTRVILTAPIEAPQRNVHSAGSADAAAAGEMVSVLLADDHQIIREGLRAVLEKHADIKIVAEAACGEDAVRLACEYTPDVVVMDVAMPGMSGIEATARITEQLPSTKVIALSMHTDGQFVLEMLRAGAAGYLLKDSAQEDLARSIRMVNSQLTFFSNGIASNVIENYIQQLNTTGPAKQSVLTPREREVLKLLAEGKLTKQIADQLDVSSKTIEAHRQHIMEKLGMQSVAELTKYAIREGLCKLDG